MKSCTAGELGEHLGVEVDGDPGVRISGLANAEGAGAEDLIYVESQKFLERAAASKARCVLAAPGMAIPGKSILRAKKPKLAFARAAEWLLVSERIAEGIHFSAIVSPRAKLGANVAIGPYAVVEDGVDLGANCEIGAFCVLGREARLGESCRLYPHVTIYPGARIGKRAIVHAGAVVGGDGFGFVIDEGRTWKFPQIGTVEIGDDVEIGSNTTIDRGSLGATRIEAGVKIDNLVQVAHNVRIGEQTAIAAQTGISGSCDVGKRVLLGGQVGISDHCTVGDGAILGAGAGMFSGKAVPAGQMTWGRPARPFEKFKKQHGWFSRLPELAERVKKLEQKS